MREQTGDDKGRVGIFGEVCSIGQVFQRVQAKPTARLGEASNGPAFSCERVEWAADALDGGAYPMVNAAKSCGKVRQQGVGECSEVEDGQVLQGLLEEDKLVVEESTVGESVEGQEKRC